MASLLRCVQSSKPHTHKHIRHHWKRKRSLEAVINWLSCSINTTTTSTTAVIYYILIVFQRKNRPLLLIPGVVRIDLLVKKLVGRFCNIKLGVRASVEFIGWKKSIIYELMKKNAFFLNMLQMTFNSSSYVD